MSLSSAEPAWKPKQQPDNIMNFPTIACAGLCAALLFPVSLLQAQETASEKIIADPFTQPLSVTEAINLALQRNSAILRARKEVEAAKGISIQTRAIAIPKVRAVGSYQANDPRSIETFPFPGAPDQGFQQWSSNIRLVQSVYEGGRILSSVRSSRLIKEQALLNYQVTVEEVLLGIRISYDDVLLAEQQIVVQEASLKLLENELKDTKNRFDAGTVPRFNMLRSEVEVANAKPRLIRARNQYRISKNNLANLLGYNSSSNVTEIPLRLSGKLEAEPYEMTMPTAVLHALQNRAELAVLRVTEKLRDENVKSAKAGYKPSVQVFGGYGSHNSTFTDDFFHDVSGWFGGAQLTWDIFDGFATKGRVQEARALRDRAQLDLEDTQRRIDLEVRTAFSNFQEAREVLESQKKVQEQAEEAVRLAGARSDAGSGTQLDLLNAQTSLTEARTTQILALHDYRVARARLDRAMGLPLDGSPVTK
ncbi:MAG: Outer rane efflux protein [Verrucomicrobiales bacterium]|nr:Outer rane efflux protein [Verrucomicrobiales bacterium]